MGIFRITFFLFLVVACKQPNSGDLNSSTGTETNTITIGSLGAVTEVSGTATLMADKSGNWQVAMKWKIL